LDHLAMQGHESSKNRDYLDMQYTTANSLAVSSCIGCSPMRQRKKSETRRSGGMSKVEADRLITIASA